MGARPLAIGIDGRELAGRPTGTGRYLRNLLAPLARRRRRAVRLLQRPAPRRPGARAPGDPPAPARRRARRAGSSGRSSCFRRPRRGRPPRRLLLPRLLLPADAWHVPRVTAVHDLSFFAYPQDFTLPRRAAPPVLMRRQPRASRSVLVCSDFTRRELARLFPIVAARARHVPLGPDDDLPPPPAAQTRARAPRPRRARYCSRVGAVLNRRCVPELLRAVAALRAAHPGVVLDIVGENRTHPRLRPGRPRLASSASSASVRLSGFVDEAGLADRYAAADAAVFLSEYEGFGLPALEAAARGVPARREPGAVARRDLRRSGPPRRAAGRARRSPPRSHRVLRDAALRARLRRGRAAPSPPATPGTRTAALTRAALAEAAGVSGPAARLAASADVDVVVVSYEAARLRAARARRSRSPRRRAARRSSSSTTPARTAPPPPCAQASRGRGCSRTRDNPGSRRPATGAGAPAARRFVLFLNPDAEVRPGARRGPRRAPRARGPSRHRRARAPATRDGTVQVSTGPDLTLGIGAAPAPAGARRARAATRAALARGRARCTRREHEPAWVSGACLMARRECLEAVGGFDEGFFLYEEDADLCRRVRAAGWRVLFTPAAEVVHQLGRSMARAAAPRAGSSTTAATCATTASTTAARHARPARAAARARGRRLAARGRARGRRLACRGRSAARAGATASTRRGRDAPLGGKRRSVLLFTADEAQDRVKIAIDVRKWRDYGIGTYVRNLVRHLARLDRETTLPALLQSRPTSPRCATSRRTSSPSSTRSARYGLARALLDPVEAAPARRRAAALAPLRAPAALHHPLGRHDPRLHPPALPAVPAEPHGVPLRALRDGLGGAPQRARLHGLAGLARRHPALLPVGRPREGAGGPERDRRRAARGPRRGGVRAGARALPDPRPLRALRRQREAAQEPRAADPRLRARASCRPAAATCAWC